MDNEKCFCTDCTVEKDCSMVQMTATLDELRAKLAAAETEIEHLEIICDSKVEISRFIEVLKERDEARAHNAVLSEVLEKVCLKCPGQQYLENEYHCNSCQIQEALSATPPDSAAKVQGLVNALESILNDGWCDETPAKKTARQALAEWKRL